MALITKEEWNDWKAHSVTRAFYGATIERVEDTMQLLSQSAGIDPVQDNFYRGFIAAYREMRDFRIDDLVDDNEGDKDD